MAATRPCADARMISARANGLRDLNFRLPQVRPYFTSAGRRAHRLIRLSFGGRPCRNRVSRLRIGSTADGIFSESASNASRTTSLPLSKGPRLARRRRSSLMRSKSSDPRENVACFVGTLFLLADTTISIRIINIIRIVCVVKYKDSLAHVKT
jgi:hypothetical protein